MYYYAEILRAKGALRIALILVGIALVVGIIFRLSVHGLNVTDWASNVENSPTAHVTRTQLPDGSTRIVVDDPQKHTHAVITRSGESVKMDIREPASSERSRHDNISMGSMSMNENVQAGIAHTTVEYHSGHTFDLGLLFLVTIPMGLIVATLLGGPLAKENDGHLELAWTKPVSRERYALACVGVDVPAILAAQLLCIAVTLICILMFAVPRFGYGPHVVWNILVALLAPIAWYALLTAASASVKRGPGLVIGLGWMFAIIVPSVAGGLSDAAKFNSIAAVFYAIFHTLAYLDPISYLTFRNTESTVGTGFGLPIQSVVAALAALSIGYIALSVLQWRRVEA
jgi:hypothetical protein